MFSQLKSNFRNINDRFRDLSFEGLLWIVNIVPNLVGFSFREDKIIKQAPFWIMHFSLLAYVYGVGSAVYQLKFAETVGDFIKSFINLSLVVFICNNSWWFLSTRPLLKEVLKKIELNDELSRQTDASREKYKKLMKIVKRLVIVFYCFNYADEFFIYLPHRSNVFNDYSMAPCVGLEPLTSSPNRQICSIILGVQEISISIVVLNYQALLLLLIAHTTVTFRILSADIMLLNNFDNLADHQAHVKKVLPSLAERHALILSVIDKLKSLYSVSLGINFASHAVCILLVIYLPIEQLLGFVPIIGYCFCVFFLYCFLCQKLVNASEDYEMSVYCCGWENFGVKEKKIVLVMLCQAQKPVEILAADIIPVNIYTFATTLQAMYKFLTVVKF